MSQNEDPHSDETMFRSSKYNQDSLYAKTLHKESSMASTKTFLSLLMVRGSQLLRLLVTDSAPPHALKRLHSLGVSITQDASSPTTTRATRTVDDSNLGFIRQRNHMAVRPGPTGRDQSAENTTRARHSKTDTHHRWVLARTTNYRHLGAHIA